MADPSGRQKRDAESEESVERLRRGTRGWKEHRPDDQGRGCAVDIEIVKLDRGADETGYGYVGRPWLLLDVWFISLHCGNRLHFRMVGKSRERIFWTRATADALASDQHERWSRDKVLRRPAMGLTT